MFILGTNMHYSVNIFHEACVAVICPPPGSSSIPVKICYLHSKSCANKMKVPCERMTFGE